MPSYLNCLHDNYKTENNTQLQSSITCLCGNKQLRERRGFMAQRQQITTIVYYNFQEKMGKNFPGAKGIPSKGTIAYR